MPCSLISLSTCSISQIAGLRIAEVQQAAVLAAQEPVGMMLGQPGPAVTRSGSNQTMIFMPLAVHEVGHLA